MRWRRPCYLFGTSTTRASVNVVRTVVPADSPTSFPRVARTAPVPAPPPTAAPMAAPLPPPAIAPMTAPAPAPIPIFCRVLAFGRRRFAGDARRSDRMALAAHDEAVESKGNRRSSLDACRSTGLSDRADDFRALGHDGRPRDDDGAGERAADTIFDVARVGGDRRRKRHAQRRPGRDGDLTKCRRRCGRGLGREGRGRRDRGRGGRRCAGRRRRCGRGRRGKRRCHRRCARPARQPAPPRTGAAAGKAAAERRIAPATRRGERNGEHDREQACLHGLHRLQPLTIRAQRRAGIGRYGEEACTGGYK